MDKLCQKFKVECETKTLTKKAKKLSRTDFDESDIVFMCSRWGVKN